MKKPKIWHIRGKIWWLLFTIDPLGFIWEAIKNTVTYQEWVDFLCRCYGHKEPLTERFSGSYCDRCGAMIQDRRRPHFYVSLHTSDPGESGGQTTNEVPYTSYARVKHD